MDGRIVKAVKVHIPGPVKLGARWLNPGEHDVTPEEEADLRAAGVIDAVGEPAAEEPTEPPPEIRSFTAAEWEAAVRAEALKIAGEAFDGELGRIEGELKALITESEKVEAEKSAAEARAAAAEATNETLRGQILELQARLTAATPSEPARMEEAPSATAAPKPAKRQAAKPAAGQG